MNAKADLKSAFTLHVREDNIGVIEINVPGDAQNTLKEEFADQFQTLFAEIKNGRTLKGLVMISTKPGSFVAGADINLFDNASAATQITALSKMCQETFQHIEAMNIPVVAAINGACLGGGLELAMACHHRIATTHRETVMGVPEVMLGLLPAGGGTQRLPRLVGIANALDMMLTGRQLKAKQAIKMGLVDEIVEPEALLARAVALAKVGRHTKKSKSLLSKAGAMELALEKNPIGRKILFDQARKQANKKTFGNYPAPLAIIDAVETGYSKGLRAGYAEEARAFGELAMSSVSAQLRNIFHATNALKKENFVEDKSIKGQQIKSVGVLGAGLMGAGITLTTLNKAHLPVRLKDRDDKGLANGVQYLRKFYDKRTKIGAMTDHDAEAELHGMTATTDYSGFAGLDLVIEAVFEDINLKHQMLRDIEEYGNENTIFASNTSSLPITEIASIAKRPENVIGLHYFSPAEKMPLLEIITHDKTSADVIAGCVAFGKAQGKTVIVVKDGTGFYTTRILAPYMNETSRILEQGVAPKDIDQALMKMGFPIGPVTLLDEVGIDVGTKVAPILEAAFGSRMAASTAASKMIDNGFLGRKTGKGFYLYGDNIKGKPVNEALYAAMGITSGTQLDATEIAERCTWMMINEAAYCLQEGIIQQPMHGDIGAIFGLGFPPFLGGPFRYMDTLGLPAALSKLESFTEQFGERFKPAQIIVDMAKNHQRFYS